MQLNEFLCLISTPGNLCSMYPCANFNLFIVPKGTCLILSATLPQHPTGTAPTNSQAGCYSPIASLVSVSISHGALARSLSRSSVFGVIADTDQMMSTSSLVRGGARRRGGEIALSARRRLTDGRTEPVCGRLRICRGYHTTLKHLLGIPTIKVLHLD